MGEIVPVRQVEVPGGFPVVVELEYDVVILLLGVEAVHHLLQAAGPGVVQLVGDGDFHGGAGAQGKGKETGGQEGAAETVANQRVKPERHRRSSCNGWACHYSAPILLKNRAKVVTISGEAGLGRLADPEDIFSLAGPVQP